MTFSNPARGAAAAAGPYVRALFEVLGEHDPLEVMAELDAWLDRRFSGVPDGALQAARGAGQMVGGRCRSASGGFRTSSSASGCG